MTESMKRTIEILQNGIADDVEGEVEAINFGDGGAVNKTGYYPGHPGFIWVRGLKSGNTLEIYVPNPRDYRMGQIVPITEDAIREYRESFHPDTPREIPTEFRAKKDRE